MDGNKRKRPVAPAYVNFMERVVLINTHSPPLHRLRTAPPAVQAKNGVTPLLLRLLDFSGGMTSTLTPPLGTATLLSAGTSGAGGTTTTEFGLARLPFLSLLRLVPGTGGSGMAGGGGTFGSSFFSSAIGQMCIVIDQSGWTVLSQTCGSIISPFGPIRS